MTEKAPNRDLYEAWSRTFRAADLWPLSLDYCARLLAVIYIYAGSAEEFTYNRKLVTDIKIAQERKSFHNSHMSRSTILSSAMRNSIRSIVSTDKNF